MLPMPNVSVTGDSETRINLAREVTIVPKRIRTYTTPATAAALNPLAVVPTVIRYIVSNDTRVQPAPSRVMVMGCSLRGTCYLEKAPHV